MAYMMQVRGRLWEYSETVKMFRPHLLRSSSSLDSSSSLSVLTPKREMLLVESEGPWETFLTPLICVISCCLVCFFFSRALDVGDGISTSFCLSEGQEDRKLFLQMCKKIGYIWPHTRRGLIINLVCNQMSAYAAIGSRCTIETPAAGWLLRDLFIHSLIHHLYLHSFVHSCCPVLHLQSLCAAPVHFSLPPHLLAGGSHLISCSLDFHKAVPWQTESCGSNTAKAGP